MHSKTIIVTVMMQNRRNILSFNSDDNKHEPRSKAKAKPLFKIEKDPNH